MSSSGINSAGAVPDATYGGSSPQPSPDHILGATGLQGPGQDQPPTSADLRLVIEDDQAAGSYVYKTIDRRTGEVVQQYPREEVLRLREASDYTAGTVIKAKA